MSFFLTSFCVLREPFASGFSSATMKHIDFYLDFISPYAYLAFEALPRALQGLSYEVTYRPILFAGLLKHPGQLGPAEIGPKRDWTYRRCCGRRASTALRLTCRRLTRSTRWRCCAWLGPRRDKARRTAMCARPSSATCGKAVRRPMTWRALKR